MKKKIDFSNVVNLAESEIKNKRLTDLTSTGTYIIPVDKGVVGSGNAIVDVVWVNNSGEQLIVVSDSSRNLLDLIFDGEKFVRFTPDGEIPDWGNNQIPGILASYKMCGEKFDWRPFCFFADEIHRMIEDISGKEPEAAYALYMVVKHIHGTYGDKYAKGQDVLDTKKMLYDSNRGDFINIYQVCRYLQRYLTNGLAKSHLIKDIEKAIHYLVFEMTRRIKMGDVNEIEPKI